MKYALFFIPIFFLFSCGDGQPASSKVENIDSLLMLYPDSVPILISHGNKMIEEFQYDKALADGARKGGLQF